MTIGQFVSSTGEAIRGILQWVGFPRAISVEFPYVVALLRNNTIEIHDITELKLVQRVPLSSKSRTISTGPGIKVQVAGLIDKLKLESGYLLNENNPYSPLDNNTSSDVDGLQILSDQGGSSSNQSNFLATIPTRLIIAGSESVVALAATPLTVQADSMLDSTRIEEALELAKQAMKTSTPDNVHSEIMASLGRHEFNYINQKSGFLYLGETLFEFAFPLFEEGGTDPRLLIQLFGNLRDIIRDDNNFTVYAGVKSIIKHLGGIDNIVSRSLVKNYDPHIKPDIESSHATQELRKALIKNAKEMLQKFLTKYREQRRVKGKTLKPDKRKILRAIDNALLRLYAESNSELLNTLLENSNECVLELSEKFLLDNKKYYPLALLYKDNKEYKKALELWKRIFEEDHPDKDGPNCLKQMANMLRKMDDHDLVLEYANWIIKHDEIIGAQIFIQPNLRRPLLIEPSLVLDQLRSVGKNGLKVYLEYLVTQRKSQEEQHNTELALLYVEEFETMLQSNEVKARIETISNTKDSSKTYLSFLLNQSTEDLLTQGRATLITFLQSSSRYNAKLVLNKLLEIHILKAELAVVYGKLNNHEKALHILVDDLKDFRGAEFYCLYAGRMIGIISSKKQSDNKPVEDKDLISTRRTLFLMLLKVYLQMQNGDEIIEKIINLLNTHAVYFDTNEVMELLPEYWSVEMLSEFLIRSLRQNYHEYREGQILKGLCRGENTMTSFELYQAYQAIGPIVINQNVSCSRCKKYISGSDFMRQPNNDIVHVHCNSEHRESNTTVSDPLSNQA
ncbi:19809_t:CDS:10 [Funneliformis geosporum]|uniref:16434_t:CDS:1 n=1 Tax=Funneliformis geosporum TaxID=1117311 RepID=A0A9W4SMB2_9GLOM|nr:19809_t:CDS:10 [Funneliformis geosporum]CAI2174660.1 16434_t:CDS:10 [Funneliformis geosporum]